MKHFTRRAATLALGIATLLAVPVTAIEPQYERQFPQPTAGGEVWIRTELYFGTDKPGDNVTDALRSASDATKFDNKDTLR